MDEELLNEGRALIEEFMQKLEEFHNRCGGHPNVIIDVVVPTESSFFLNQDWGGKPFKSYHYKELEFHIGSLYRMPFNKIV